MPDPKTPPQNDDTLFYVGLGAVAAAALGGAWWAQKRRGTDAFLGALGPGYEVFFVSEDDDDDNVDVVRDVFFEVGINPSREEEVLLAATHKGEVVGGATFGSHIEDDYRVYTFSVAILPEHQKLGVGRELVQEAVKHGKSIASEMGEPGYFRVWVVNPNMAKLLEDMGFDTEGREWTLDSPHMVLYF